MKEIERTVQREADKLAGDRARADRKKDEHEKRQREHEERKRRDKECKLCYLYQ